jgi:ABC-type transporter Mla maintaining outer membrane lipid asymmetry permease subunit MlaE
MQKFVCPINIIKDKKVVPLHKHSCKQEKSMILTEAIKTFGSYLLLMKRVLTKPERWLMFFRRTLHEIYQLGVNSIPIVLIISLFIGAALCI